MATTDVNKNLEKGELESYVISEGLKGAAIGGCISGTGTYLAYHYWPAYRRFTNISARSALLVMGPAMGFALYADWATVHYYRYMDRPEKAGFASLDLGKKEADAAQQNRLSTSQIVADWAATNKFWLIGGLWGATISTLLYKDFRNPNLTAAAKFGHARIGAQFVTLGALAVAFAFTTDKHHQHERD